MVSKTLTQQKLTHDGALLLSHELSVDDDKRPVKVRRRMWAWPEADNHSNGALRYDRVLLRGPIPTLLASRVSRDTEVDAHCDKYFAANLLENLTGKMFKN